MKDGIPVFSYSQSKNLPSDLDRNSSAASIVERSKNDIEVELPRETLVMWEGKEKLTSSADHGEIINAQLKLVEIMNHLGQIQQLRQPKRQASLPPSSSKSRVHWEFHLTTAGLFDTKWISWRQETALKKWCNRKWFNRDGMSWKIE